MFEYSGWNPYATPGMAAASVSEFIDSYDKPFFYGWVIELKEKPEDLPGASFAGTIGAYDYHDGQIEVGFSVVPGWQGRGLATEAMQKVLEYLTENEGIPRVTAWCAAENVGSKRVMEKAGMRLISEEKGGLEIGGKVYDQLNYEYRG